MEADTWAVIIDSRRGTRRLDSAQSSPSSLETVEASRTVLDWSLYALSSCGATHVTYVGGYHIQKVIETTKSPMGDQVQLERIEIYPPPLPHNSLISPDSITAIHLLAS